MTRDYLPKADALLMAWSASFTSILNDAPESSYGLAPAMVTVLGQKQTLFAVKYQATVNATTRTRPAIAEKDLTRSDLVAYVRMCVGIIQKTPSVTDAQRLDLKITVAKKRAPQPAPTARPMVEVLSVVGRLVTVNVYDSTSLTKRGKPKNCVGAKLYTFVGASYPSDPTLWAYQGDYTKAKVDIQFAETVAAGSQVFLCAAWYTRTNVGPVCVPVATVVQYGGVQAQSPTMKMAA